MWDAMQTSHEARASQTACTMRNPGSMASADHTRPLTDWARMQVFPTKVRALGLGVNNAMSRVGALLSPFMAVALVERGMPHAAEGIIAGICVLAAIATLCLPLETAGKALLVSRPQSLALRQSSGSEMSL